MGGVLGEGVALPFSLCAIGAVFSLSADCCHWVLICPTTTGEVVRCVAMKSGRRTACVGNLVPDHNEGCGAKRRNFAVIDISICVESLSATRSML